MLCVAANFHPDRAKFTEDLGDCDFKSLISLRLKKTKENVSAEIVKTPQENSLGNKNTASRRKESLSIFGGDSLIEVGSTVLGIILLDEES
jgi:hypothetical protein